MDPRETEVLKMGFYKQAPGKLPSSCRKHSTEGETWTVASSTNGWSLASLGAGEVFYENVIFKVSRGSTGGMMPAEDSVSAITGRLFDRQFPNVPYQECLRDPLPSGILTERC